MSQNARGPFRRTLPLMFAALLACAPGQPALSLRSESPTLAMEVEYGGCSAAYLPGPVCVLPASREIRFWAEAPPDAQVAVEVDGTRIQDLGKPVGDGQQFVLIIPSEAKGLTLDVEALEGRASWSLSFVKPEIVGAEGQPGPARDVLGEIQGLMYSLHGDIEKRRLVEARRKLQTARLPPEAPAESRYLVRYYRGVLAEKEGDYRSALAEVEESVEIAERVGLGLYQRLAEEKLALLLRGVGRSREAAQIFDHLRRTPHSEDSCTEAQLLVNQAWSELLAREAGESFGDPIRLLEAALKTYETCVDTKPEKKANILINLALAHLQEDRLARAKEFLARARETEPHAPLPHLLWRLDLEARIALREGFPADALHRFEELAEQATTSSPDARLRAAFGQAQSYRVLGDPAAALETLRAAEALLDEQTLQIPVHEGRETFVATRQAIVSLHVEILLDQGRNAEALNIARHGRSRVLRQLERVDRLASLTPDLRARWARLLTAYQDRRAALEERMKDEWRLPADRRLQEQAARRAEAEAIEKLLDQAFLVLGNPEVQPGDEGPPPRPGELILAYHPLSQGWARFAADETTVTVHRFELPPEALSQPQELARLLLLPFRASIERAQRIRILPSGSLRGVDFHALPFGGTVLLARSPVVYGLDLPVSASRAPAPGGHALLIADPRSDLPGALAESRAVRDALDSGSRRWITEELKRDEASADSVRNRLASADLLHYAGHGTFSGFGGWESSLLLAGESRLTLGDFLTLDRAPAWVVLSACDSGLSSAETPVEGLGLAQAFLLAGSQAVVASTRPANDRKVPEFFTELYRQWELEPDLAVAVQRAQLFWRKQNPEADWASFRLFVP